MGEGCLTLKAAWEVYDGWLGDPHSSAPKALADCYLLAMSQVASATLVTFDAGLHRLARGML